MIGTKNIKCSFKNILQNYIKDFQVQITMVFFLIVFIILIIPIINYIYKHKETSSPLSLPSPSPSFDNVTSNALVEDDYEIISKCTELSHSHADIGTVTPIELYAKDFCIIPYQSAKINTQKELADKLHSLNKDISREYILENWRGSDVMYVMISGNDFIGSVAVDRKNFEPFISHLYVDEIYRNKGYGKKLLEYGILYSREFKFNIVKLWCEQTMIPYYEKLGWKNEKQLPSGLYIMQKYL